MKRFTYTVIFIIGILLVGGCVSPKKLQESNLSTSREINNLNNKIKSLNSEILGLESYIKNVESISKENNELQKNRINKLEQQVKDFEIKNKNLKDLISKLRIEVAQLKKQTK